jgi:hypothetical protein
VITLTNGTILSRQTEDKGRRAKNTVKERGKYRRNDKVGAEYQLYILYSQAQWSLRQYTQMFTDTKVYLIVKS